MENDDKVSLILAEASTKIKGEVRNLNFTKLN